ncbi:MAG: hypothetical protein A2Y33_01805 [Spirochaetes bacterium GWF1_51_8]|nr:MAG: hypothetical protein A2Y33_01805 [Spirochaetes bacterium GWF1_51_8]
MDRRELFFEVHTGETREGPGSPESTRKAFSYISGIDKNSKVIDIGCGPGWQTLELARLCGGEITAIDLHEPFLDILKTSALKAGYGNRLTARKMSMTEIDFPDGAFDLVWSEGAIYFIGFTRGLKEFRRLLKTGGYLAVSEATWLKPNPPDEVKEFWNREYPAMGTLESNLASIDYHEYEIAGYFVLPPSDWEEYFSPLKARFEQMLARHPGDPDAEEYYREELHEFAMYDKYREFYGYVFYILKAI